MVITNNVVYVQPLQVLKDVIFNNVTDINSNRSSQSQAADRAWIFPTTPDENDERYPRLAIIPNRPTFDEHGAFRIFKKEYSLGKVNNYVYGNFVVIPVTIGVFVKKKQTWPIIDYDGSTKYTQNSLQVAYLLDRIQKMLNAKRSVFIANELDFKITGMTFAYEDNEFLWAGEISIEILVKNYWTETPDPTKIINQFVLSLTFI